MAESPALNPSLQEIGEALRDLARGESEPLSACLKESILDQLNIGPLIRCHYVALSPDGRPRTRELIKIIRRRVIDYVISRERIQKAARLLDQNGSTAQLEALSEEAHSLFTKLNKTGEPGELLLFILAEGYLGLAQAIPKMSLKTDSQMHFHGADGVFLGVRDGLLGVYWGESKFYQNISRALDKSARSLSDLLRYSSETDREFALLANYLDLGKPELEAAIQKYIDIESAEYAQLQMRGLCLVGFDFDGCQGHPLTNEIVEERIAEKVETWSKTWSERIEKHRLVGTPIDLFLLPIESVDNFRTLYQDR